MSEQWLPIPGFEHCGEVSDLGRIRSRFGKIRKTVVGNNGYERVGLKKIGGKNTNYVLLHRLVAFAFCPGHVEGYTVNHIDGNKLNNRASNLEWVSAKNNIRHAYRMGLRKGTHRKPIIPHEHREMLMAEREKGITYRELAERYGVANSCMVVFLKGRTRKTVIYETA